MIAKPSSGSCPFGGAWSLPKLQTVEGYAETYLTAMKSRPFDLVYIDAFAGAGYQKMKDGDGDSGSLDKDLFDEGISSAIRGSALRAIGVSEKRKLSKERGFDRFYFIDKDKMTLESLRAEVEKDYPDALDACVFMHGDANTEVLRLVGDISWKRTRGVIFLDPFATQLQHSTLQAISNTDALDAWILIPISALVRMMPLGGPSESCAPRLDQFFGDDSWRDVYTSRNEIQMPFDGMEDPTDLFRASGIDGIQEVVRRMLESTFPAVVGPKTLRTDKNTPLFQLWGVISNDSVPAVALWRRIANHWLES